MRLSLVLFSLLIGCGGAGLTPTDPTHVVQLDEMRIVASHQPDGNLAFESYDASDLFERATALLNAGQCHEAVAVYDRIVSEFATSRFVSPSLYNSGLCLQDAGENEAAIPYYRRVIELGETTTDARHASFLLLQALIDLERWDDAITLSEHVLLREDLGAPERLEGLARRSQALLGADRLEDAARQANEALSFYRTRPSDSRIAEPEFAATANFVLAETMRLRSERMTLPEADAQTQHQVLDQRAGLLLQAQREYFNTIRHTDAHWAAAAGYRIGAMYDALWHALMSAPIPPPQRQLTASSIPTYQREYRSALAEHIRPLLRHAIRYWELTLMMVERTGARSEWADRARADLERMRGTLLEEESTPTPSSSTERPVTPQVPEALLSPRYELPAWAAPSALARGGSRLTARQPGRT